MAPPAAVEGGDGGGGGGQPQQQQGFGQMFTGIIRVAVIYYFASKFFSSNKPSSSGSDPAVQISNLFQKSEPLDCQKLFDYSHDANGAIMGSSCRSNLFAKFKGTTAYSDFPNPDKAKEPWYTPFVMT
ncbi:hypothetical protein L6452_09178 [Arctium lappa]|uniref:Uncharacterized protein n=1 Tax=Arctium lappa TaxID=4217 RepID=A0ACB9DJ99_ARCLA|nr:hypothetical protein L6452_09178 [Arctium lappa]